MEQQCEHNPSSKGFKPRRRQRSEGKREIKKEKEKGFSGFAPDKHCRAATVMTGKEKRTGCLLAAGAAAAAVWVGGPPGEAKRERGRRAGGRAGLPALSPAPACLDKTHGTCGGISMRHHTWRKRQLNPAPSTTGPGSTKSSQHLEWISGDAADFTAPSRVLLTLPLFKKKKEKKRKKEAQ